MGGSLGGWVVGSLENWRVILISAFNYVIVEVVAEIGKIILFNRLLRSFTATEGCDCYNVKISVYLSVLSPQFGL